MVNGRMNEVYSTWLVAGFRVVLIAATTMPIATTSIAASGERATCHRQPATIVGTNEDDTIRGTPRRDVIVGSDGDDRIFGRGGNDLICGEHDHDRLWGGPDDDELVGGAGYDVEFGARGDDVIRSAGAYDTTEGDSEHGGDGSDMLIGDAGQQWMYPGRGDDVVRGGNCVPRCTPNDRDVVVYTSARRGVRVDLQVGRAIGQGEDVLRGVDEVVGSDFDDVILGRKGLNTSDQLSGGEYREGGPSDLGRDVIRGRGGTDWLYNGICYSDCPSLWPPGLGGDRLYGGYGRDFLDVAGRNNHAFGGRDTDNLYTGSGRASLIGGLGGDIFSATRGEVRVRGGPNRDSMTFSEVGRLRPRGPVSADLAAGTASSPYARAELTGIEDFIGSWGNDMLTGDSSRNNLKGLGGNDTIYGRRNDDHLDGGDGIDELRGGAGADTCVEGEVFSGC